MEFQVTTNLAQMQPQKIDSNVAEVRQWLQSALEPYKNMVVSEDAIASAKATKADVNKLKKAIDDKRKLIKKQWVTPYLEWEKEVNECLALCDEAYNNINSQVAAFENEIKEQKKGVIKDYFDEASRSADVDSYIKFEDFFDQKWLNATVKTESVFEEIDKIVGDTVEDIKTICDLESDYAAELLLEYSKCHDVRRILQKEKELKEMASRKAAMTQKQSAPTQTPPQEVKVPQTAPNDTKAKPAKKYDLLMQLRLTLPQAKWLKTVLAENGIEIVQSKMKESN